MQRAFKHTQTIKYDRRSISNQIFVPSLHPVESAPARSVDGRWSRRWRCNRRYNRRFGDETADFGDITAATSGTSRGFRERSERPQLEAIALALIVPSSSARPTQAKIIQYFSCADENSKFTIPTTYLIGRY